MITQASIKDERSLLGYYKANGLTDSDSIYGEKIALLKIHRINKFGLWALFVMFTFVALLIGALLESLIVLAFFGIVPIFIFMRIRKTKKLIKMINSVTAQYCKDIGVDPA